MSIPQFAAELALTDSGQRYRMMGNPAPFNQAVITPSQCRYFCGPANSCATILVPSSTQPDAVPVRVQQCCGWGFRAVFTLCGIQVSKTCNWVWDPWAHCDVMVPADPPPPPPPPPPPDCTTVGCPPGNFCCDCPSPAVCLPNTAQGQATCRRLCNL
jgi:hypothetical protein